MVTGKVLKSGGRRHDVLSRWKGQVIRDGLLSPGAKVIAGVSGGADSVALLHLLYALRHDLSLHLTVAHYDHALRAGSSKDCAFVRKMTSSLGLDCVWERNTQPKPQGVSVEDFARQRRFDFFIRQANAVAADAVILAHTQDDLAETVLMRILRGT
ncbi:MAG: tRNA lysidine(34) synthetase TilS, partial [Candidatus Omnitrophota bacterium]